MSGLVCYLQSLRNSSLDLDDVCGRFNKGCVKREGNASIETLAPTALKGVHPGLLWSEIKEGNEWASAHSLVLM